MAIGPRPGKRAPGLALIGSGGHHPGMRAPSIEGVLETALYTADLDRAAAFYRGVVGLPVLLDGTPRLMVFDAGRATVLLLFQHGATTEAMETPGGRIPPHHGHGPAHFAFAVSADAMTQWERYLPRQGVEIESRVQWPRGGRSLYFRDPDGHSVELATPGTWPTY